MRGVVEQSEKTTIWTKKVVFGCLATCDDESGSWRTWLLLRGSSDGVDGVIGDFVSLGSRFCNAAWTTNVVQSATPRAH